jgi:hypothetical protein
MSDLSHHISRCASKRLFYSRSEAKAWARKYKHSKLTPYECNVCGCGWHLTSHTRERSEAISSWIEEQVG